MGLKFRAKPSPTREIKKGGKRENLSLRSSTSNYPTPSVKATSGKKEEKRREKKGMEKKPTSNPKLKFPAFPFEPYPIQIDFMNALYHALDKGGVAMLESPTGNTTLNLPISPFPLSISTVQFQSTAEIFTCSS